MSILNDASLVLYYDFGARSDQLKDLSLNNHVATKEGNPFLTKEGMSFDGTDDYISIADADDLSFGDGTTGEPFTIAAWANMKDATSFPILSKRTGADAEYRFTVLAGDAISIACFGQGDSTIYIGKSRGGLIASYENQWVHVAASYDGGSTVDAFKLYVNGIDAGGAVIQANPESFVAPSNTTSKAFIGFYDVAGFRADGQIANVQLFSRELTITEINELMEETNPLLVFPSKPVANFTKEDGSGDIEGWKTDYSSNLSETAIASGQLENTPFQVQSGTHKVSIDTINGKDVKVIECVTAGIVSISSELMNNNTTEGAYGEWELWFDKGTTNTINISLSSQAGGFAFHDGSYGYMFQLTSAEAIIAWLITNGTTVSSPMSSSSSSFSNSWNKLNITRTVAGIFSVYINDELVNADSGGSNPFTENTHTTIGYINFDLDAGDKIALSDMSGDHSIIKKIV